MGECICKLPLIPVEEQSEVKDFDKKEERCEKCGKTCVIVIDKVTFGTDVEEVLIISATFFEMHLLLESLIYNVLYAVTIFRIKFCCF